MSTPPDPAGGPWTSEQLTAAVLASAPTHAQVEALYTRLLPLVGPDDGGGLGLGMLRATPPGATSAGVVLELSVLRVAPAWRGRGVASRVLTELTAAADAHGWVLCLRRDGRWGADLDRLGVLYRRFGFGDQVAGTGLAERDTDMVRLPGTSPNPR